MDSGIRMNPESEAGSGVLGVGVECSCGYALAGLAMDSKCPECGSPCRLAVSSLALKHASPEYLRALRSGLGWLVGAFVVRSVSGLVQIGGVVGLGSVATVGRTLGMAAPIAAGVGWWLVTTRDARASAKSASNQTRVWLRWLSVVGCATGLYRRVDEVMGPILTPATSTLRGLFQNTMIPGVPNAVSIGVAALAGLGLMLVWVLQFFYGVSYLRRLGARAEHKDTVSWMNLLSWLSPLLQTVGALVVVGPAVAHGLMAGAVWGLRGAVTRAARARAEAG